MRANTGRLGKAHGRRVCGPARQVVARDRDRLSPRRKSVGRGAQPWQRRPHPIMLRRRPSLEPCLPTRAAEAPAGPGWIHEI
jgi:hypothetical protein